MSIIFIAASSFVIALSGALVPGPLFSITVSESAQKGFRAGPMIILGHGLLEIAIGFLLVFEITPFLSGEKAKMYIGLIGGFVLIVMGGMLIRDARTAQLNYSSRKNKSSFNPVLAGVVGSLSNPYWTVWWITIGLGYLVSSLRVGMWGVVAFFAGHIAADLAWYSLVSFAVARGRRIMGEKGYRYLLSACGIFLVVFGGWFIAGI